MKTLITLTALMLLAAPLTGCVNVHESRHDRAVEHYRVERVDQYYGYRPPPPRYYAPRDPYCR